MLKKKEQCIDSMDLRVKKGLALWQVMLKAIKNEACGKIILYFWCPGIILNFSA